MRFAFCALLFASCVSGAEPVEALDLVNAQRAQRGLPPYQRDAALTQAAAKCATFRANHSMHGHTGNDFQFLPAGAHADAAGCAAWKDGFGACAMFETQYRTAGAAWVRGADGLRYCHLFVRRGPPAATAAATVNFRESPAVKQAAATPKAGTVHCTMYSDLSKTKILKEWDEPAGTAPSGRDSGNFPKR